MPPALRYRGRLLRARHFQKPNDLARKIGEDAQPDLARDFHAAFTKLRDGLPIDKIRDTIAQHRYREAARLVPEAHFRHALRVPFDRFGTIVEKAGYAGSEQISAKFRTARKPMRFRKDTLDDTFNFSRFDLLTQEKIRDAQDALITQLSSDARDTIESVILDGVRAADTPEEIASTIRNTISLTDTQAQAVSNYQRMLEELDPDALARQLRNTEMDATVQDAIDSGDFLPNDVIDQLVSDYADNYLSYRAMTIARTESMRASNMGLRSAYSQAIESGALPDAAVTKQWQLGDSPCPICESIPAMNPDGVAVDSDFASSDGPVDDAPVHPNCMCSIDYVTNLDMVPDE